MWINETENKIYDGNPLIVGGFKYFNPSNEILQKAGYVYVEEQNIEKNKISELKKIQKKYQDAVQKHLDKTAQSKGYDSIYTCLSYLNSTDVKWKSQAEIFNAWRDQVWSKCHELLNKFKNGEIEQPTITEVINALPKINW